MQERHKRKKGERIMECPRGSVITESEHKITTLSAAKDWARREVFKTELPLTVVQQKARNGRIAVQIFANDGRLIARRG